MARPPTPINRASRPSGRVTAKRPDLQALGTSGLRITGGYVFEEYLPELVGPRGRAIFREMADNDPVIGAMLFAVEHMIHTVDWFIQPYGTDPLDQDEQDEADQESEDNALFVDECLHDMSQPWSATLSEILTMLVYGWSYFEIVYKRRGGDVDSPRERSTFDDGKIGWRKLAPRGQNTLLKWEQDDDGGLAGMWQMDEFVGSTIFLPIEKCLLFRTTHAKNNPEGRSVLRNAYRPWFLKRNLETVEAIGIERDLAGLPVIGVPPEYLSSGATPEQAAVLEACKQIVTGIKRDEQEGIVFPLQYDDKGNKIFDLQLLSTGGQRQINIDPTIARYDQRITMTILADFLLIGHEKVGAKNLSESKTGMFAVALAAWLDGICNVINQHAIPRLLRLNGMNVSKAPRLVHGDVDEVDLDAIGSYIQRLNLGGAPLFADEDEALRLMQDLMSRAKLPIPRQIKLPPDPEEMAKLQASLRPPPGPGGTGGPPRPGGTDPRGGTPQRADPTKRTGINAAGRAGKAGRQQTRQRPGLARNKSASEEEDDGA